MRKKSILLLVLLSAISVCAQDTIPSPSNLPVLKRNEISINTLPVFKVLLNAGNSEATRHSLAYKRNFKNGRSALRFSFVADNINKDVYGNRVTYISENDTMRRKQRVVNNSYWSPHINIGYERLFGQKKLKWFYGADLSIGYSESRSITQNYIITVLGPHILLEEYESEANITQKSKTFSVGIIPFFGVKYPLSRRFSISMQLGTDIVYGSSEVSETSASGNTTTRVTTIDFNQNTGLMNDISLVYKF
ncbi:MAG: hypothetical protein M3R27_12100 [Bacteroidota bacterium]|nr:hypothetical protein [Bacteroidota bacterium]